VIVLSCVIWVFAERAVTQSASLEVNIELEKSGPILLEYLDEQGEPTPGGFRRVRLMVEGPAGRIQQLNDDRLRIHVPRLDGQKLGYTESENSPRQDYTVQVVNFFDGKLTFGDSDAYLQIVEAEPPILPVRVTKLTEQTLPVKVYDQYSTELAEEIIRVEPKMITALLPEGRPVEARIDLSSSDQIKAAQEPITATCQVNFSHRSQKFAVQVQLLEGHSGWPSEEIARSHIRVGVTLPLSMTGKYRVVIAEEDIDNLLDVYGPIHLRGSPSARSEYRDGIHLVLDVKETDAKTPNLARPLRYNLTAGPEEIEIIDRATTAVRFHLEPITE